MKWPRGKTDMSNSRAKAQCHSVFCLVGKWTFKDNKLKQNAQGKIVDDQRCKES